MSCKICKCNQIRIIYHGRLRNGSFNVKTDKKYDVYQCEKCGLIWNDAGKKTDAYYESGEYKKSVDGDNDSELYYRLHDKEVLKHLEITGTDVFRGKVICDIGCGAGSFLDFVSKVSKRAIAIEPDTFFGDILKAKHYETYRYAYEYIKNGEPNIDLITSFDVIEHVENPYEFAADIYNMLNQNGECIVGTPTDYPILREAIGDKFNQFIFSVQHPWIFSMENMQSFFDKAGFREVKVETIQQYGIGNLLLWLQTEEPKGDVLPTYMPKTIDVAYKQLVSQNGLGDYIVVRAKK